MNSKWYAIFPSDNNIVYCEKCNKIIYKKGWIPGAGECKSCFMELCMDCAHWDADGNCKYCQSENKT